MFLVVLLVCSVITIINAQLFFEKHNLKDDFDINIKFLAFVEDTLYFEIYKIYFFSSIMELPLDASEQKHCYPIILKRNNICMYRDILFIILSQIVFLGILFIGLNFIRYFCFKIKNVLLFSYYLCVLGLLIVGFLNILFIAILQTKERNLANQLKNFEVKFINILIQKNNSIS